jgi:outer membrane protein assembly factor BamB
MAYFGRLKTAIERQIQSRSFWRPVFLVGALASCDLLDPGSRNEAGRAALIWQNSEVAGAIRVTFDDRTVYTLGGHRVAAVTKDSGRTLWQVPLAVSVPSRNGDGIMLASGKLIVGDIDLLALDPSTGRQLWKFNPSVGAWPGYSKQWTDGVTVVCGSATGHVYAVDVASGNERWVTHIVDDTNTNVYSPVVSDGVVYVGYTHFEQAPHARRNGGMAALDFSTGRLLWNVLLPHGDSTDVTGVWADPDAIVLTPTMVVALAADDKMYGADRRTGQLLTTLPPTTFAKPGFPIFNPEDLPSIGRSADLVIGASSTLTTITALSATDLSPVWKVAFPFGSPTRIAVGGDRVYSGAAGGQFVVYDLDGRLVWQIDLGDLRADRHEGFFFPPAIDSDRIYLPGNFGVYAFKKQ